MNRPSLFLSLAPSSELMRVMGRNNQSNCVFSLRRRFASCWSKNEKQEFFLESCKSSGMKPRFLSLVTPIPLYESSAKEKNVAELTWSNVFIYKGTKQILLRTSNVWQQQGAW